MFAGVLATPLDSVPVLHRSTTADVLQKFFFESSSLKIRNIHRKTPALGSLFNEVDNSF